MIFRKTIIDLLLFAVSISFAFSSAPASAKITVDANYNADVISGHRHQIDAGAWLAVPFQATGRGTISATVTVEGVFGALGDAFICSERDVKNFRNRLPNACQGAAQFNGTAELQRQVAAPGNYFILMDNRANLFTSKTYQIWVSSPQQFTETQRNAIRDFLLSFENDVIADYKLPPFNLAVESCGMANAFSNGRTGDITFCSELVSEIFSSGKPGALAAILLHELGHSALSLWGLPNYANEETADEVATYMMMREGGEELLSDFIAYWSTKNSWDEAQRIIQNGDTHPLSAQRARNIERNIKLGRAFTSRWNRLLYPQMTDAALRAIARSPGKYDDVNLANSTLRDRRK